MEFFIAGMFIGLDVITGIIKAIKLKKFNSSGMREGLIHKCGSILCIALGALVEFALGYLDLGVDIPVAIPIIVYVVTMEIGSIIENIHDINPEIVPEKLSQFFEKLNLSKGDKKNG